MATIRFNLHEALAETKIQEAIDLAPPLLSLLKNFAPVECPQKRSSNISLA